MDQDTRPSPINEAVRSFVTDVQYALTEIRPLETAKTASEDALSEAFALTTAMIDVDGFHTDKEIGALLDAFRKEVPDLDRFVEPWQLREAGVLKGARVFFNLPSKLFGEIVTHDGEHMTRYSWWYYNRAMELAQLIGAVDLDPTVSELRALERLRTAMLNGMELAGVRHPATERRVATSLPGSDASGSDAPQSPPRPLEELLAELNGLIGLKSVKSEVKTVANYIQVQNLRREKGLSVIDASRHLVFTGNPGTGKTTVARLLAEIYRSLHVVRIGHLVETDRSGLVAGYVGQTAIQVRDVFKKALGGVLLIDEAYALARGGEWATGDFGQEAIDTLVKLMEDHRDDVVVIVAGYPAEMSAFIASNPGLQSRFPTTISFSDYATDDLLAIFDGLCGKHEYQLSPQALGTLGRFLDSYPRQKGFGNGRLVRNIFEATLGQQAGRIMTLENPNQEDLCRLTESDLALDEIPITSPER